MEGAVSEKDAVTLDLLLEKVYRDGGHDFREYKRGILTRRLERRLRAAGVKTYIEYMQFLDAHPEEYQRLTDCLTIAVSGFFRKPYAFQQVARLVLPELVLYKRSQAERSLRVWSTACARGEEPYSIAILLAEYLKHDELDFDISIYATDISRQALKEVGAGGYSTTEMEGIAVSLRDSYFARHNGCYEVRTDIKQMVRFSYFDLTSTLPPIAELDIVFCCNILIYMQRQLQERVLGMLTNSLATPGYLILGEVETPTNNLSEKLKCLDARAKIYKKGGRSGHV